ncbi:potassium channel family protein [Thermoactinospora rubra]|uniref:potassium channel family protein n=1 Tax=Thermoactinospora rubra TaxID=1088767 RepID=UPI000A11A9ED|nr:potassium channel family protein [Thermoactinospora rubra]
MTAADGHRRARWLAWARASASVVIVTGLYFVVPLQRADLQGGQSLVRVGALLCGLAAVGWLVGLQVRRALSPARVLAEQVAMLLMIVDVVVVFFAGLYVVMADQFDGLVTRLDALYFAVETLSTVGYGDITPVGQAARAIVIVQMIFDLLLVTSAISIVLNALRARLPR